MPILRVFNCEVRNGLTRLQGYFVLPRWRHGARKQALSSESVVTAWKSVVR
jgi:hypothetical protein